MEIKTKFNVGDKVYIIYLFCSKWKVALDKYEIIETNIKINNSRLSVNYTMKPTLEICSEKYCFATKEEAQKECDKRNGK